MKVQLSPKEWQQISEYLDDQLPPKDKNQLEDRIRLSPDLRAGLEELRQTRLVLRSVPQRKAPHNFTLTPEMVRPRSISRLFPVLSFSSALATILIVVTLVLKLLPSASSSSALSAQNQAAPAAPAAPFTSMAAQNNATVETQTSPTAEIVIWGQQPNTLLANNSQRVGAGAVPQTNPSAPTTAPLLAPGAIESQPATAEPAQAPALAPAPDLSSPPVAPAAGATEPNAQVLAVPTNPVPISAAPVNPKRASPILGIPAHNDQGKIITEATPQPSDTEPATSQPAESQPQAQSFPSWILLEAALAVIAIATGLGAYSLWRKAKM
ncbi:MAG TPA: hypothetical protein VKF38_09840 [Anaerolineaceae bacterium]|nr:hypothetical protein [Anaerolineaceae bacterium]